MGEDRRKRMVDSRGMDAGTIEPAREMQGLIWVLPVALLLWAPVLFFFF